MRLCHLISMVRPLSTPCLPSHLFGLVGFAPARRRCSCRPASAGGSVYSQRTRPYVASGRHAGKRLRERLMLQRPAGALRPGFLSRVPQARGTAGAPSENAARASRIGLRTRLHGQCTVKRGRPGGPGGARVGLRTGRSSPTGMVSGTLGRGQSGKRNSRVHSCRRGYSHRDCSCSRVRQGLDKGLTKGVTPKR